MTRYNRSRAQRNVTVMAAKTQAAIDEARVTAADASKPEHIRKIAAAIARSHTDFMDEIRDAQDALNEGENPPGWDG